jgi:hypothetical protein
MYRDRLISALLRLRARQGDRRSDCNVEPMLATGEKIVNSINGHSVDNRTQK